MNKIISDDWLTGLINKPAYSLQNFDHSLKKKDLPEGNVFIWTKIPVDDVERLICLQKLGFYIVDTNIQYFLSRRIILNDYDNVRFARPDDSIQVRKIANDAFKYDRFHADPNIPNYIANKIKKEWAGNFFLGKRGNWMVVCEKNSKIIGFLQLISKNEKTILIDLIAIDEKSRGNGLAKKMISYAYEKCLLNNGSLEVGTQLANLPSIKLYSKIGFHMNLASYVLHKHT